VFFCDDDYLFYLELLKQWCTSEGVEIWAYCLMPNHVHLILKPRPTANLSKVIAETHRRYTRMIHFRENWRGFLWPGRFSSYPMAERYLLKAAAYVEFHPVRAKRVACAWDYRWSSVHAHLNGEDPQKIVEPKRLLDMCGDWHDYLLQSQSTWDTPFEQRLNTGRPLGDNCFIEKIESLLGRDLKKKKPGPTSDEN